MIKVLSDLLDEKLEPIKAKLDDHTVILKNHSEILNQHSIKLDEHTQILRALEHLAQVNKAEHDNMANDIAHMKGDIESIKKASQVLS